MPSYTFTLKDCVENVKESLIDWDLLLKTAELYGLKWYSKGALEVRVLPTVCRDAKYIIELNRSFSFYKVATPS